MLELIASTTFANGKLATLLANKFALIISVFAIKYLLLNSRTVTVVSYVVPNSCHGSTGTLTRSGT